MRTVGENTYCLNNVGMLFMQNPTMTKEDWKNKGGRISDYNNMNNAMKRIVNRMYDVSVAIVEYRRLNGNDNFTAEQNAILNNLRQEEGKAIREASDLFGYREGNNGHKAKHMLRVDDSALETYHENVVRHSRGKNAGAVNIELTMKKLKEDFYMEFSGVAYTKTSGKKDTTNKTEKISYKELEKENAEMKTRIEEAKSILAKIEGLTDDKRILTLIAQIEF